MARTPLQWEPVLARWAKPEGVNEEERCTNATRMIKDAIDASEDLIGRDIEVFSQGSFENRTNVARESDVDIVVLCKDVIYNDFSYTPELTIQSLGLVPATYEYAQLKNDVGQALVAHFGSDGVTRRDKVFDLHANTYRVQADVLPGFVRRLWYKRTDGSRYYIDGVWFRTDKGKVISNYPRQHIENGKQKNKATNYHFKYVTRVLKALRYEMADQGIDAAKDVPSFLIECLAYNTPNEKFAKDTYYESVVDVLIYHAVQLRFPEFGCTEWLEVNQVKYLFHNDQAWTREQSLAFVNAAWTYLAG